MKRSTIVALLAVVLAAPAAAQAGMFTFTPNPPDLNDLDHTKAYSWAIDWTPPAGESIISAELSFTNIRNWDNDANALYVDLLNSPASGVHEYTDNEAAGDYFASFAGKTQLITYWNLPSTPQNLTYTFTASQLATLNTYAADGHFGIAIDPDCHFYNDCVKLKLVTPEPATVFVLVVGVLTAIRRRSLA